MRLCGLEDAQHGHGPAKKEQPAAVGGDGLVVAGAEAEEVAELVVTSAEPGGRSGALEALHEPVAALEAPVVLLQPITNLLRSYLTLPTVFSL